MASLCNKRNKTGSADRLSKCDTGQVADAFPRPNRADRSLSYFYEPFRRVPDRAAASDRACDCHLSITKKKRPPRRVISVGSKPNCVSVTDA